MKKERLTIENRMLIEQLLRVNYKLKDIALAVDSNSSTVSREIKKRRITGKGLFKECEKTKRFPFVCNGCTNKTHCRKKKYYYNYIKAQKHYDYLLKHSRIGIDMSLDEIDYWNEYFKDKIKHKNQPILHLFNSINIHLLMMKCFLEHIVTNLERELMKSQLSDLITLSELEELLKI